MNAAFWLRTAALLGFLAVAFGAFGAHWLEGHLKAQEASLSVSPGIDPTARPPLTAARRMEVFGTGVHYHMFHAVALMGLAVWLAQTDRIAPSAQLAGWAFVAGIALFSGSLYALAFSGLRALGMITPIGGVAFLVGWAALFVAAAARLRP